MFIFTFLPILAERALLIVTNDIQTKRIILNIIINYTTNLTFNQILTLYVNCVIIVLLTFWLTVTVKLDIDQSRPDFTNKYFFSGNESIDFYTVGKGKDIADFHHENATDFFYQ